MQPQPVCPHPHPQLPQYPGLLKIMVIPPFETKPAQPVPESPPCHNPSILALVLNPSFPIPHPYRHKAIQPFKSSSRKQTKENYDTEILNGTYGDTG